MNCRGYINHSPKTANLSRRNWRESEAAGRGVLHSDLLVKLEVSPSLVIKQKDEVSSNKIYGPVKFVIPCCSLKQQQYNSTIVREATTCTLSNLIENKGRNKAD